MTKEHLILLVLPTLLVVMSSAVHRELQPANRLESRQYNSFTEVEEPQACKAAVGSSYYNCPREDDTKSDSPYLGSAE